MQEASYVPTKSSVSHAKVRLIELMQRINYGRIEGLPVRRGEPVMDPPPRIVREIKFSAENGPRPESAKADFSLKVQVHELFAQLEARGDGVIPSNENQRGMPLRMTGEEVGA
jgi:hypothetical protein